MKSFIFAITLSLLATTAKAESTYCPSETVTVNINGLVCDFCARAMEKLFGKRGEVASLDVDLNNGRILITLNEGATLSDDIITQLVTDSGYTVTGKTRGCAQ
jgi:copper chaperone CopZ